MANLNFLILILRECLEKATDISHEKKELFYEVVQTKLPGCPTAIMTFMSVIDNFRKYLTNVR